MTAPTSPQPEPAAAAEPAAPPGSSEEPQATASSTSADEGSTDGTPGGPDGPQQGEHNWEKRFKDVQREYTRLRNQVGPLANELEAIGGGEGAMRHLESYNAALSDPNLGPVLRSFVQTGEVELPKATSDSDDEYVEPAVARLQEEVKALRAELHQSSSQLGQLRTSRGMDNVTSLTEKFMERFPMTDEQSEEFKQALGTKLARIMGNENGQEFIRGIDAEGFDTVAMPLLNDDVLHSIAERRYLQKQGQLRRSATDAPPSAAHSGREAQASPAKSKNFQDLQAQVRAAVEKAGVL